jgi:micrococcal nuclease
MRLLSLATITTLLLLVLGPAHAQESGVVRYVYDGDTLEVTLAGKREIVRLIGIDAPETHDNKKSHEQAVAAIVDLKTILALGERAANFVRRTTPPGSSVRIEYDSERRDEFNRVLAYVYLPDGTMLNEKILSYGYAKPMIISPNRRFEKRLIAAAAQAKAAKRGLWSMKGFP